jgi:hypothetical protein
MSTNSTLTMFKFSPKFSLKISRLMLSATIAFNCLNPSIGLAQSNSHIQQLRERQADYQVQAKNLQLKIGFYMLRNPYPSMALLMSGVGVAAALEENLDPSTKGALMLLGATGVGYCMNSQNIQYCAEVTTTLVGYGMELDNYNRAINSISQQISSLQE